MTQTNAATIPMPQAPAKPKRVHKRPQPIVAPIPAPLPAPQPKNDLLRPYAYAGVGLMASLSALLNGYANSQHASVPWAGWGMGLAIPAIVLILAKVAGLLWKRGQSRLALCTAGSGAGLLLLSVWHCATSIALLTGGGLVLAIPMAIAIDAGFVCSEIATLID